MAELMCMLLTYSHELTKMFHEIPEPENFKESHENKCKINVLHLPYGIRKKIATCSYLVHNSTANF